MKFVERLKKNIQDARTEREVLKAKRQERKIKDLRNRKPGPRKIIGEGRMMGKSVREVMEDARQWRRDVRESQRKND